MYFAVVSNIGKAKLAEASANGQTLDITQIAVGDGNGDPVSPNGLMTTLVNEVWRDALNTIYIDSADATKVIFEGVIPHTEGGFTVREVGLFDSTGDLIAVANYPDTEKPVITEGVAKELYLRLVLQISDTSAVTVSVDPSIVMATKEYVDQKDSALQDQIDNTYTQVEIDHADAILQDQIYDTYTKNEVDDKDTALQDQIDSMRIESGSSTHEGKILRHKIMTVYFDSDTLVIPHGILNAADTSRILDVRGISYGTPNGSQGGEGNPAANSWQLVSWEYNNTDLTIKRAATASVNMHFHITFV